MEIDIDIDGLHCDGKLVMIWADASDLVARDKLIAEFEVPDLPAEERDKLNDRIWELEDKVQDLEDEMDGYKSDCDYLEELVEKLKGEVKNGLHEN